MATEKIVLDDLLIDLVRRQVFRDGSAIALPVLSFNTLAALLRAAPEPISAEKLMDQAWEGVVVSNETVVQRIRLLRHALGDDVQEPRYVETVRNAGYRLIPQPRSLSERNLRRAAIFVSSVALALALVAYLAWPSDKRIDASADHSNIVFPDAQVSATDLMARARELFDRRSPQSLNH